MQLQENKKCCKIIDEILLFFLRRGIKDISFSYKISKHQEEFLFTVKNCSEDYYVHFKEKLIPDHEMQYEAYAWELMGDADYDELGIVGGLIDGLETNFIDGILTIRMVRNIE